MSEVKKGFLGLTTAEWGRALSTGGLSLVFERNVDDSESSIVKELTHEDQVAKAKDLGRVMLAAKSEIESIPREALIEAAWQGIAHYHVEATIWGSTEAVQAFEEEKELRLSLLTDEERERAIFLANDWLDDNFDK
jgi:hypothetical protein